MRLLKIGRDAQCNIVINSQVVSGIHAEMTLMNSGDILLEDKNSHNGTFVNGNKLVPNTPCNVKRGDKITFGNVELQWSQVPPQPDTSMYSAIYEIGSNFNNDIQLSGATVSRFHATIVKDRKNRVFIIDHSKNGTTVDGIRIQSDVPHRLKSSSVVVCGGVPLEWKSRVQMPTQAWKVILAVAASILVLFGVGFGAWKIIDGGDKKYTDDKLYSMYNNSVVMIRGLYHYKVTAGDLDLSVFGIRNEFVAIGVKYVAFDALTPQQIVMYGTYNATGFFVSEDGKLITNLHVVKPWLFDNARAKLEEEIKKIIAQKVATHDVYKTLFTQSASSYSAYISMVKVEGILDGLQFVPQGRYFSQENAITCRVLSAGEDTDNDLALIQSEKGELPSKARYVNVTDSIVLTNDNYKVGTHMFTLGFPFGDGLQNDKSEKGIQALAHGGSITQADTEFSFGFNAPSYGGASGSPVFDEKGFLMGVVNSGVSQSQGFNFAIKAKHVKDLIDNPHRK